MRNSHRTIAAVACVMTTINLVLADNTDVPPSFRKQAIQAQNEQIQNSAVTPVPVDVASQPGYIQSGARGNLAAYSNAESYSTFQLNETKAQLLVGPASLVAGSIQGMSEFDINLRYQLSPRPWPAAEDGPWHLGPLPLSLFLEGGVIPSGHNSDFQHKDVPFTISNGNGSDNVELIFNYQAHLALIDELPHGHQSWVIPEIGAGFSVISTHAKIYDLVVTPGFTDESIYSTPGANKQSVTPYFSAGVHLFPEHFISLNLRGSYIPLNFDDSVEIPSQTGISGTPFPGHALALNAPSSVWALEVLAQIKLAWPTLTHTPLIPQLMPPWLMPSYTTDEISPWVAASEVTERYNQPGHPPVGNVMFQYKNKWVNKVEIIGEFNDWTPEPMIKDRSGIWVCVKDLPVGKFRYNYVLDGKKEILDPWNKNVDSNSRQSGSSIVAVK